MNFASGLALGLVDFSSILKKGAASNMKVEEINDCHQMEAGKDN
jgi:hypothetical protein